MKRKIKYRAWNKKNKCMITFNNMERCDVSFYEMARGKYGFILMQYTGEKDKNRKEIYEGDIVYSQINNRDKCKVIFRDGAFGYIGKEKTFYEFNEGNIYLEVIGNIYKNKELLK